MRRTALAGVALLVCAAAALAASGDDSISPMRLINGFTAQMDEWREANPLRTAIAATLFLAVWIVCLVPSTVIELWLGFKFGLLVGFLLVYAGKVLGCLASFALGRTVLQNTCKRCLSSHELFRAFDLAVSREPYTVCVLARASYVPISFKNYAFAVSRNAPLPACASVDAPCPCTPR